MATIDDLPQKSISEMTLEELEEYHREIRGRRAKPSTELKQKAQKHASGKRKAKPAALGGINDRINLLSEKEKRELLASLMGEE